MKRIAPLAFVTIIILGILEYLFLLPLSLGFASTWIMLIVSLIAMTVILGLTSDDVQEDGGVKALVPTCILLVLVFLGYSLITSPIFTASARRQLIGNVKEETFSTAIDPIDINKARIVDGDYAVKLADKVIGENGALGSQFKLGDGTIQQVNGNLEWVFPLLESGFFVWQSNPQGSPGYITVNATNPLDVKLVQQVNGKPIYIKYQPNAWFSDNLERYVFSNGHTSVGMEDYSFEVDDSGRPYYVITKYKNTIGFGGQKVLGTIVVDAQTGEIKDYDVSNTPAWVDRVFPEDTIYNQINSWGKYIKGFWNFSNNGVLKTTNNANFVYDKGDCYFYTGITSSGKDSSLVGFTLTDTRTGATKLYKVSGAIESSAMSSAEGKVQNYGYKASSPILTNVEGQPTYFMTLKDKEGTVKLYAFASVQDYTIVGTGQTAKEALEDYTKYLGNKGNWTALESSGKATTLTGTIQRFGQVVQDNGSYFYMILNEAPNQIFVASIDTSNELPITNVGDKVTVKYREANGNTTNLTDFDNLQFTQTKTATQSQVEAQNQKVQDQKNAEQTDKKVDTMKDEIQNLSDADKAKVEAILNSANK